MSKNLYFIPRIAEAIRQPDPASALLAAFAEIRQMGQSAEFRNGYAQFVRFMQEAMLQGRQEDSVSGTDGSIWALMVDMATDGFAGTAEQREELVKWIQATPTWAKELEAMQEALSPIDALLRMPTFQVLRGKSEIGTIVISQETGRGSLGGIAPGEYSILLETGWLLWQGNLTSAELTWAGAFPNQPLALAAATGGPRDAVTLEEPLLEREWVLRVSAGVEAGRMEIARSIVGT